MNGRGPFQFNKNRWGNSPTVVEILGEKRLIHLRDTQVNKRDSHNLYSNSKGVKWRKEMSSLITLPYLRGHLKI